MARSRELDRSLSIIGSLFTGGIRPQAWFTQKRWSSSNALVERAVSDVLTGRFLVVASQLRCFGSLGSRGILVFDGSLPVMRLVCAEDSLSLLEVVIANGSLKLYGVLVTHWLARHFLGLLVYFGSALYRSEVLGLWLTRLVWWRSEPRGSLLVTGVALTLGLKVDSFGAS